MRPGTLIEQWRVLEACIAADKIVIHQASNTGLTGGSVPQAFGYDRDVVIVSTLRLVGVQVIEGGRQVICLPGATLHTLERVLKPFGREPHSVIGSSCLGASVIGGLCNSSGGALVRRGPAFTELALYGRLHTDGRLELVNHLGLRLGDDPETILGRLERGQYGSEDIEPSGVRRGSDHDYERHVRAVDADSPARYNASPRQLSEASGSAGRLAVFAVRLDTFEPEPSARVLYVGTNDPGALTTIRRRLLRELPVLPITGEYIHRDAFDVAAVYGKDMYLAIRGLGTDRLPALFRWKARLDRWAKALPFLPDQFSDRCLQWASGVLPKHLPLRLRDFRDRYAHHLLLKIPGDTVDQTRAILEESLSAPAGDLFECTPEEAEAAFLHRFAVAGAAVRYRAVHHRQAEDVVALDIALRRNDDAWFETLPADLEQRILHKLYYGHFFCHVFHQDYIARKGTDVVALEHDLLALVEARGAAYPAEHNVGHLYEAMPNLAAFYRELDPCNQFNPGIGKTSKRRRWGGADDQPRRSED